MVATSRANRKRKQHAANMRSAKEQKRLDAEALRAQENRFRNAITRWDDKIDMIETALRPFEHAKGKPRTPEQNVMVAQTCIALMKAAKQDALNTDDIGLLSVQSIDKAAAEIHKFKRQHVTSIRNMLHDEESLIIAFGDPSKRGGGSENYQHNYILSMEQQEYCYTYIEEQHAKGVAVANRKLRHNSRFNCPSLVSQARTKRRTENLKRANRKPKQMITCPNLPLDLPMLRPKWHCLSVRSPISSRISLMRSSQLSVPIAFLLSLLFASVGGLMSNHFELSSGRPIRSRHICQFVGDGKPSL